MEEEKEQLQAEKAPKVAAKSFMTVGPTLHYSHQNVMYCWLLALAAFVLCCLLWLKVHTGSFWPAQIHLFSEKGWQLGHYVVGGISIFEYPWQIIVLGALMGVMAIVPLLESQLMSFQYSLPFILMVFLVDLPGLAVSLLVSCFAVACRPLRFRSRFISIALCTAPQLAYWGFFGGAKGVEPIQWGFSSTPWVFAWVVSLTIAGLVLGIGHFTRYRPGVVWAVTIFEVLSVVVLFEYMIGFAELDYQLYIAKNNPEYVSQFHDRPIKDDIDATITNPNVMRDLLAAYFYPTDPIQLRAELKREMQDELEVRDSFPRWFKASSKLNYHEKRQRLFELYDLFIKGRPKSKRMPIALYYKAILSEYSPDVKMLGQKEVLHFYNDYPQERTRIIWYSLYSEFGKSPESIEARWRIAKHWAGQERFEQAINLLAEAEMMADEYFKRLQVQRPQTETILSLFQPPSESAITMAKLIDLRERIEQLKALIEGVNIKDVKMAETLARFVLLNPYLRNYQMHLDELVENIKKDSSLYGSIIFAKTMLIEDEELRAKELDLIHAQFPKTYSGMRALYELGRLRVALWRHTDESNLQRRKTFLEQAKETLKKFISLYPDSLYVDQVKEDLSCLPAPAGAEK